MKYGYVATLGLAAFVTGALMNLDPRSVEAYVTSITSRIEKFFLYNPAKRNLKLGDMLMEKVLGAMEARDKSREWMYLDSDTIDNVSSAILSGSKENYSRAQKAEKWGLGRWVHTGDG